MYLALVALVIFLSDRAGLEVADLGYSRTERQEGGQCGGMGERASEVSVQIFCPFLIGLFVFLLLSFRDSLYILDTSPLLVMLCKHFLPVYALSFQSLNLKFL